MAVTWTCVIAPLNGRAIAPVVPIKPPSHQLFEVLRGTSGSTSCSAIILLAQSPLCLGTITFVMPPFLTPIPVFLAPQLQYTETYDAGSLNGYLFHTVQHDAKAAKEMWAVVYCDSTAVLSDIRMPQQGSEGGEDGTGAEGRN